MSEKTQNLRRLQAQRNELNAKGNKINERRTLFRTIDIVRLLREELQVLQEQGSYVGEVVKAMDKKKVLVKVYLWCIYHVRLT